MDIIDHLIAHLPLKREDIGIAWLKDKDGITRQRFTFYKRRVKSCGGEEKILALLSQKCQILKTTWHQEPLMVWKNAGNRFIIRLRKREALPENLKIILEQNLEKAKKIWFPNAFGIQRFWKGNKNFKKALKIFQEWTQHPPVYEVKFKLQSRGSMRFNEYLMQRREKGKLLLDWDIMVNAHNGFGVQVAYYRDRKLHHFDYRKTKEKNQTQSIFSPDCETFVSDYNPELWTVAGPVLGWNQLLPPVGSKSYYLDQDLIAKSEFLHWAVEISRRYQLYGFRRALRVLPKNLDRNWEGWDLCLSFSLPTGAYASSFLASLLKDVDSKGCISNGLIIPRIAVN